MDTYRGNCYEKFSINVGIINFNEGAYLFEGYKKLPGLKEKIYNITYNLSFNRKLGKPLDKVLKNLRAEIVKEEHGFLMTKEGEDITSYINRYSYLPLITNNEVHELYPYEIILTPTDNEFDFYFALRFKQVKLQEVDEFLNYHLKESFLNDELRFLRFLQISLREYKKMFYSEERIKTSNEWITNRQKERKEEPIKNTKPLTELISKIDCKTKDQEIIRKYFEQLVQHEILNKEEVNHILEYSFDVFKKDVEKKRFTPLNIGKGEFNKFVHTFFNGYSYSRNDANQWIKLILMDSVTINDRRNLTEEKNLKYIKDNWSKNLVNYRFKKVTIS